jgi:hypothetical protein
MEKFGFKKITSDNWNEPDIVTTSYTCPFDYDEKSETPPYLNRILKLTLDDTVPIEIHRLFEVARGAMIYSYFFYPLYTLAIDQLSRVGEAALYHKTKSMGMSKKDPTFSEMINFLKVKGIFNEDKERKWNFFRDYRNFSSHRNNQSLYPPAAALGGLEQYVKEINDLFS